MSYNVSFISLGCAKNVVNCEQMMARVRDAGHQLLSAPEGADVVVVNTCGFIDSAKEEAIDNILRMLDIDNFKQINDRFGHPVGDEALIQATGCIRAACRTDDFLARYGGDEFVAVIERAEEHEVHDGV